MALDSFDDVPVCERDDPLEERDHVSRSGAPGLALERRLPSVAGSRSSSPGARSSSGSRS